MSDSYGKSCNGKHLTVSEISGLIDGRREDTENEKLWKHLSSCDRCNKIFRESAIDCGLAEADLSVHRELPELVDAGLRVAVRKKIGEYRPGKRTFLSSLSPLGAIHRYATVAAAVALVVVAGVWLLNIDRVKDPGVPRSVIEPVQHAIGTISRWGPIIIHGGEYAIVEKSAAYRSGFVPATNSLRSSLDYLYARYEGDSATPEGMYWLAAGYVATGQIDLARDLVADTRKNGIDDLRVLNLEALIAYIEGDLDRAEELFRSINVLYTTDAVCSINFAVVLMEHGKSEESSRILTEVTERFSDTSYARRAQILLDTM